MKNAAEKFASTSKANLEAIQGLATKAQAGVEQLVELNLSTTKAALSDSFGQVQAALSAKDAQELSALQAGMPSPWLTSLPLM